MTKKNVDVVRVPGIAQAIPKLVEAKDNLGSAKEEMSNIKGSTTPTKNTSTIIDENENGEDEEEIKRGIIAQTSQKIKQHVEGVTQRNSPQVVQRKGYTSMEETVLTKMTEEKIRLEENLRQALETNARLQDTVKALQGQIEEQQVALGGYRQLGSTEDLSRVLDVTETMLHNRPVEESDFVQLREQLDIYEELGTPDELEELFDKFETFMNQYEDLGTPEDLHKALDTTTQLLEGFSDLGSPTDINEAFDSVEVFMGEMANLGSVAELNAVCDLLEAYQQFGTPTELQHAFEMMNALVDTTTAQHVKAEGRIISTEYGVDQTVAESLITAMGTVKARETLGAINESRNVSHRYVAPAKGSTAGSLNEDAPRFSSPVNSTIFNATPTSRAVRLFEKMSR